MDVIFALENIQEVAQAFLQNIGTKKIIAFNAPMGTGKTTFINALCTALQVISKVSSPTFSIINEYNTADDKTVYHLDLYRLKDEQEAINAGVEDCLYSGNVCLVEWPERIPTIFPEDTLYVKLEVINSTQRRLSF